MNQTTTIPTSKLLSKIAYCLLIVLFFACKQQEKKPTIEAGPSPVEESIPEIGSFIKTFEGDIDGKYPIMIKLNCNAGKLTGHYYYKKVGQEIRLEGQLNYDGQLILSEYNKKGDQTGQFEGSYTNGKLDGLWSKPGKDNKMSFELLESNSPYAPFKNLKAKLQGLVGRYSTNSNDSRNVAKVLHLNQISGRKFHFDMHISSPSCTGDVEGTIEVSPDNIAVYRSLSCKELQFEFKDESVEVKEIDCNTHGLTCSFSGTYSKSTKKEIAEESYIRRPIDYSNIRVDHSYSKSQVRYEFDFGWGGRNLQKGERKDYFYLPGDSQTVVRTVLVHGGLPSIPISLFTPIMALRYF